MARKYTRELHANEFILLAYYIAAINIETTYHEMAAATQYTPFEGIVLTDTFESRGYQNQPRLPADFTKNNNARLENQQKQDIRVIIGNPPWSAGQQSENDDNKNRIYPALRNRISQTYAKMSNARLRSALYDTYVQAVRWASDRLEESSHGGVIAFITNGGFINSDGGDGLRKVLTTEFTKVYCYNLRGDQRTADEKSRQEGGKLFGSGSRAGVAVLILVKKPGEAPSPTIHYSDIGDYLDREQKLAILSENRLTTTDWQTITPNQDGDWINQRTERFQELFPLSRIHRKDLATPRKRGMRGAG